MDDTDIRLEDDLFEEPPLEELMMRLQVSEKAREKARGNSAKESWDDLVQAYNKKRRQNLVEAGYIKNLRFNNETGDLEEMIQSTHDKEKWRSVCSKEEQSEEREREYRLLHRVRSDSSFAVTAAMIAGLASRILMIEDGKDWVSSYHFAAYMFLTCCVVGFNMIYIITCAMVYFNVYRILSNTSSTAHQTNARLLSFWHEFESLRQIARDLFLLSIPMFLVAMGFQGLVMMPSPANHVVCLFLLLFAGATLLISVKALAFTEVYMCGALCKVLMDCYSRFMVKGYAFLRRFMGVDDDDMERVITPGRSRGISNRSGLGFFLRA